MGIAAMLKGPYLLPICLKASQYPVSPPNQKECCGPETDT
jgi:hypothetical protein